MSATFTSLEAPLPSLARADPGEQAALDAKLQRERVWYEDAPRFRTPRDIGQAIDRGDLVYVEDNANTQLIARFRKAQPIEGYIAFATPAVARLVADYGELYRKVLEQEFNIVDPAIRLALTSITRTQQYQDQLTAIPGRLASSDSRHCAGVAFDLDVSAYYRVGEDGVRRSHSHPGRKAGQIAINQQLQQQLGSLAQPTLYADNYDPAVTEAAVVAAEQLHAAGAVNLIKEFSGTPNACLHIAGNPDY